MNATTIRQDGDGLVWIHVGDEGRCSFRAWCLGVPREGLYDVVPAHLWPELGRMIADREDAVRYGRDYRDGVEETYRSQQL